MSEQIELYLDNLEDLSEKDREYIEKKYHAVVDKVEEIDNLLNTNTTGWKTAE